MTGEPASTPWAARAAAAGGEEAEALGRLTLFLARHYQTYLDTVLSAHGISSAHVTLLSYLWSGEAVGTQNDLARSLGVDKGTVSRNVSTLVRQGLVKQSSSSADSRACLVELTPKGWELAEPVSALVRSWGSRVTEDLSREEAAVLLRGLELASGRSETLVAEAHGQRPAQDSGPGDHPTLGGPTLMTDRITHQRRN